MFETKTATQLWRQGIAAWESGNLSDAITALDAAIESGGPNHDKLPEFYSSLGGVLARLGRNADAQAAYERALTICIERNHEHQSSAVVVARYFLAEHLIAPGGATEALQVIAPSLGVNAQLEGLLRVLQALGFEELGQTDSAAQSARQAMELAISDQQRERFRERLASILNR